MIQGEDRDRECPICEGRSVEVLHSQELTVPEGHPLSSGFDVVCCVRCGFVYTNTTTNQDGYDHFYAQFSKYEDKRTASGASQTPWDSERLCRAAQQIAAFMPNQSSNIIDIGCASGGLLKHLAVLGFVNLCGIDPSPMCVHNVLDIGIRAYVGSLFRLPEEVETYDCVILSHVLEHVCDLRRAVEVLYGITKPGGCIYIEVPDASRYADNVFAPYQDFNTEHINHFSKVSLLNLMQSGGFRLAKQGEKVIQSSPQMPYPVIYGIFFKEKHGGICVPRHDDGLAVAIRSYILKSKAIMESIKAKIQLLCVSDPYIVWGTGQLTMKLLVETSLSEIRIVAFVDSNPINHGKTLHGVKIISPGEVYDLPYQIIVASILHQTEILNQIKGMGLSNDVILL